MSAALTSDIHVIEVEPGQHWHVASYRRPSRTVVEVSLGFVDYADLHGVRRTVTVDAFRIWARRHRAWVG